MISFIPLAGDDPQTYSRPAHIQGLAHRTRHDSLGKPYYVQQPDPDPAVSNNTPTTLITYSYFSEQQTEVITSRLSVASDAGSSATIDQS